MGYFDSIRTENNEDMTINNVLIKGEWYQSKDFMYDKNNRYWVGDSFIISKEGYLYFENEELKKVKITGLVNIYGDNNEYYLLLDENKIIDIYKNTSFEDLPDKVQKEYNIIFK